MILCQEIIYAFAMFISKSIDYQNLSDEQFKKTDAFTIGKLPFKRKKSSTKSSRDTGRNGNGCNGNSHETPQKETERFFFQVKEVIIL